MKKVTTYMKAYLYGIPCRGDKIFLSNQWKVVKENGDYWLEFKTTRGEWIREDQIIVIEREEFLNECG